MRKLFTLDSPQPFVLPLIAVIAVAASRQLWWLYLSALRGPLGLFAIPCVLFPFVGILFFSLVVVGFIAIRSMIRTKSVLPTLVMLGGIFLVFQIPLPSYDTPEKQHFLAYRADYEAVVEMARAGDLTPCQRSVVSGFNRYYGFEPPPTYAHVSGENCIEVVRNDARELFVTFFPLERFYHHIVYTESGEIDARCRYDPHVEQEIDPHWYVCEYEWN